MIKVSIVWKDQIWFGGAIYKASMQHVFGAGNDAKKEKGKYLGHVDKKVLKTRKSNVVKKQQICQTNK
jgi:hypothetical protein